MPLSTFAFTPAQGFRDSSFAPTDPPSETALRDTMQDIPDQLRDALNALINTLNSTADGSSGADNIAATPISGVTGDSVQEILESLYTLTQTLLPFPDGSVTNAKLSTDVKVGSLALSASTDKSSVIAITNELDSTKLDASSYTANDVLSKMLTVDTDDSTLNCTYWRGWKIYSSLSDLGLPPTPTLAQIFNALPNKSVGYFSQDGNVNMPTTLNGILEVINFSTSLDTRTATYTTHYPADGRQGQQWIGSYRSNENITTWKKVITDDPITTTITTGFASGWSGTVTAIKNHMNLVELTVDLLSTTDISFANVYTLATGLRPARTSNGALFGLDSSGTLVAGAILNVSVSVDGTILIFNATPAITGIRRVYSYKIMYYTT